jgi:hypothetical protein
MKLNFEKWLLEYIHYETPQEDNNKQNLPWKEFRTHEFTEYLKNLIVSDKKRITKDWEEEISWIEQGNNFSVNINPFGSLRITCRKEIMDNIGEKIMVCKYVLPVNDEKTNQESKLAQFIYEKAQKICSKNIDYIKTKYNIENLANELYNDVTINYPKKDMFPTRLRKMNENYYKIVFEFKGQGVGVPGSQIGVEFNIDLFFDKERGLIKCWGYDISSPTNKRQLNIQPSEWNDYFSPKEKNSNIIKMISRTLSTY